MRVILCPFVRCDIKVSRVTLVSQSVEVVFVCFNCSHHDTRRQLKIKELILACSSEECGHSEGGGGGGGGDRNGLICGSGPEPRWEVPVPSRLSPFPPFNSVWHS